MLVTFRSALVGTAVALSSAAMFLGAAATAAADDPPLPNCTAADLAGVMAGVSAGTSVYLFTHPDVNAYFTSLKGLPKDQIRDKLLDYMDANPQVRDELRAVRQPSFEFRARCGARPPAQLDSP